MLDVLDGEQQLVGGLRLAAEFAAVVGQDGLHRHAEGIVEGLHALIQSEA